MNPESEYINALRTALAASTSVLAGNDLTRPGVIVAENQALLALRVPSQWIAVSDRKPEDGHTVLAGWFGPSCSSGLESLTYSAADAPDSTDGWRDAFGDWADEPTHWMPLPAPPNRLAEGGQIGG